jgi:chorismate mutase
MVARNRTVAVLVGFCLLANSGCARRAPAPSPTADEREAAVDVLLQHIHDRLELMHLVAQNKWNTQAPIFDPERERALLASVVERGREHQLDAEETRAFFAAQMEAAKFVQEDDFRAWHAENRPPFEIVHDLPTLRKRIDGVNLDLLAALARARPFINSVDAQKYLDARSADVFADVPDTARAAALRPLRRR